MPQFIVVRSQDPFLLRKSANPTPPVFQDPAVNQQFKAKPSIYPCPPAPGLQDWATSTHGLCGQRELNLGFHFVALQCNHRAKLRVTYLLRWGYFSVVRVLLNLSTLSSRSFTIEFHGKVHMKAIKLTYSAEDTPCRGSC